MTDTSSITPIILRFYPDTEAIYLFGSYGTEYEQEDSDVDIAVLLPPLQFKTIGNLIISDCRYALEDELGKKVDLINLRSANTVFQHEIIGGGRLIYSKDEYTTDTFEMMATSLYQKLNEERAGIIEDIIKSGRVLAS